MAIWLIRAGRYGEREDLALNNNLAVIGWSELNDLSKVNQREQLSALLEEKYPDEKLNTRRNWEGQIWRFSKEIKIGDTVALPLKHRALIMFGKVTGKYQFRPDFPEGSRHTLPVKWEQEIPRTQIDQDLLYSLGSAMTVCTIKRNNAEVRLHAILEGKRIAPESSQVSDDDELTSLDIEQYARDQIVSAIIQKFKGHGLERLTAAILQAQGYQTRTSPEGPDGGVDIIAGRGPLGFESPRMVVQVKSSESPIDVSVLRELNGVMSTFNADFGLIVAWGGYRGTVEKESARQYFKIRLWDADMMVKMIQDYYTLLPDDIQAELPLKQIWTLVTEEEE